MKKSNFWKSYGFLILMLTGIVAGCVVGAIWPAVMEVVDGETIIVDKGATVLEPLGTVFLNLMFCIAVPTVFCSISPEASFVAGQIAPTMQPATMPISMQIRNP